MQTLKVIFQFLKWFIGGVYAAGIATGVAVTHWYRADQAGFAHEAMLTCAGVLCGSILTHVLKVRTGHGAA